jgi:membrane associated rhomboid family serine protease
VIPLGTDRPLRRPTLVTYLLVAINVAVAIALFTLEKVYPGEFHRFFGWGMLIPQRPWAHTFVTYAFLHAGWMHLAGNMLVLWVFGPNVEDRFGRLGYLGFYLAAAAASGGAHCLTSDEAVIGASGAIAAVTGAYIVLFPRTNVKCLLFILAIGIYWIPAAWFIGFAVAKDLFWLATTSNIIGSGGRTFEDSVARTAHLGGYAMGAGLSLLLLWTGLLKREVYDLFSIGKQALRRRQLRELAARGGAGAASPIGPSALEVGDRIRKTSGPGGNDARAEALSLARAGVLAELAAGRPDGAIERYRALLREFGDIDAAGVLPRRPLGDLANALFLARDHATAAAAYEAILSTYPKDAECPRIRLMLGLINARYLNDPLRAKAVLTGLDAELRAEDERRQARELLAELA